MFDEIYNILYMKVIVKDDIRGGDLRIKGK